MRRSVRGDRGAVPDQRPLGAVRRGARRCPDPVPGSRRRVPAPPGAPSGAGAAPSRPRLDARRRSGRARDVDPRVRSGVGARLRGGGHAAVRPRAPPRVGTVDQSRRIVYHSCAWGICYFEFYRRGSRGSRWLAVSRKAYARARRSQICDSRNQSRAGLFVGSGVSARVFTISSEGS